MEFLQKYLYWIIGALIVIVFVYQAGKALRKAAVSYHALPGSAASCSPWEKMSRFSLSRWLWEPCGP